MVMDKLSRGKRSIALNLKSPQGQSIARKMISKADVVLEPFRPGISEFMEFCFLYQIPNLIL